MLELEHVTKTYKDQQITPVLADITLSLKSNEFVSIVGPSGSGKTTLLRAIAGLMPFDSGRISVGRMSPCQARKNHLYGYVFQTPALCPWRTVLQNVELPLIVARSNDLFREAFVNKTLDRLGLGGFSSHYPHQLSGGMQQLVSIARAMILDPPLLLLDEPFGSLDAVTRERMNTELENIISSQNKTVVLVTHSIEEAVYLSDRVLVMSSRPSRVCKEIAISRHRPRGKPFRKEPYFFSKTVEIRTCLEKQMHYWHGVSVISGEGRGRTLGFPTLNLDLKQLPIEYGVHVANVFMGQSKMPALLHYGPKSTFGGKDDTAELFILDQEIVTTPKHVDFEIVQFLRPTMTFETQDALVRRMNQDKALAKQWLSETK